MATAQIPRREPQANPYAREQFEAPQFEQLEPRWTWEHVVALSALSVVAHIVFALAVVGAIVLMPKGSPIVLTAQEILGKDTSVYMPLTGENSKPIERPKTNIISDKDRRTATRNPSIDRKTLKELADNLRPGAPSAPASAGSPPAPAMQAAQPQQPSSQSQPQPGVPQQPSNQIAQLHTPPLAGRGRTLPNFGGPATAGSAIQQAARAAAETRGGGDSGEYGSGPANAATSNRDALEIVSDTLGVDFAPYLSRMRVQVYNNWYNVMPESVFPPWRKKGVVVIEFSILKNGTVTGLKILSGSGDVALDRAAYAAISASNPMGPLPADFKADYLTMRARFYYNPDRANELR